MHIHASSEGDRAFFLKESRTTARFSTLAWASRLLATAKAQSHSIQEVEFVKPRQPDQCYVLSDGWAYLMQMSLFTICLMTLLLKWYMECPRRPINVFTLDCSKQAIAASWYHALNMCFAMRVGEFSNGRFHDALKDTDECSWYFITFLVDVTLGLVINFLFVKLTEELIGYESGRYWRNERSGLKVDWREFSLQLSIYCMIITLSKLVVVTLIIINLQYWAQLGVLGTLWIQDVDARLLFVMVITPGAMDTLFFWVTDEFIKHRIAPKDKEILLMPPKAG
jgi:hypothetical protein